MITRELMMRWKRPSQTRRRRYDPESRQEEVLAPCYLEVETGVRGHRRWYVIGADAKGDRVILAETKSKDRAEDFAKRFRKGLSIYSQVTVERSHEKH